MGILTWLFGRTLPAMTLPRGVANRLEVIRERLELPPGDDAAFLRRVFAIVDKLVELETEGWTIMATRGSDTREVSLFPKDE